MMEEGAHNLHLRGYVPGETTTFGQWGMSIKDKYDKFVMCLLAKQIDKLHIKTPFA